MSTPIGKMILFFALAIFGVSAVAQPLDTLLVVRQTYAGGVNSINAFVVRPAGNGSNLQVAKDGLTESATGTLGSMPITDYPAAMTDQQIMSSLSSSMQNASTAIGAGMQAYMEANGVGSGVFDFEQKLYRSGGKTQLLVATVMIGHDGQVFFGDPRIVDQSPGILYAIYTPLAVANGLPQNWAYPNAGTIQWQMRDMNWNPLTAMHVVNVNGAYDPPQYSNTAGGPAPAGCSGVAPNVTCNPDFGLSCLSDKSSSASCPQTYPDIKALIAQNSAAFAILDYTRTLQPVYTQQANGTRTANAALSVNSRVATYNGCGGVRYDNSGAQGFKLQAATDRYLVQTDGGYSYLNEFKSYSLSPTLPYSGSVTVTRAQAAGLPGEIVNPDGTLVPVSSVANLVYLAPVAITGNTSTTIVSFIRSVRDSRDYYSVAYTCTGNSATTTIPVTLAVNRGESYPSYLNSRCGEGSFGWFYGSLFSVSIDFSRADSQWMPLGIGRWDIGLDVYDNSCVMSNVYIWRHGCAGGACSASFKVDDAGSGSAGTFSYSY